MREDKDEIVIGTNKSKSFIMTIIAFIFFAMALWAATEISVMPNGFDKIFLMTGVLFLIIVFGLAIISGISKMLVNNRGLLINDNGININIGPNQGQFIEWNEIKEMKLHSQSHEDMFLLVFIENPKRILKEAKGLNRFLLKMNNISHKTPVSITSTWLNSDLIEIMEIINERMNKKRA